MRLKLFIPTFISILGGCNASLLAEGSDSLKNQQFTIHTQTTIINQYKPAFTAPYTGGNSLVTEEESKTSVTSTLFLGSWLWKGASIYVNPEMAGGSGLSGALGIAAATNGETFRIGNPAPAIYLARLFFNQVSALSDNYNFQESDANQLQGRMPEKYLSFTIGKVSIADYFDDNQYSHDPRSQFMSWALMDNGAWDYAANTRGYTPSVVVEYITPKQEWRLAASLVPKQANGSVMNWDIARAGAYTLEYTHRHTLAGKKGAVRLLAFYNTTDMGNYRKAVQQQPINPDIDATHQYGNNKLGIGINAEQSITDYLGGFFRASWNDGKNETWMFTEIDRSISAGLSATGKWWKRPNDNVGLAFVTSGLSKDHRNYLKAGGKGFMLGDGNLNYTWEKLLEFYYSATLVPNLSFSGAYQMVTNPGYNKDRKGPVHIFSVRVHFTI
jgi:high affinity Mn2+ porin